MPDSTRRHFLAICATVLAAPLLDARMLWGASHRRTLGPHPTPRPGITSAKVLTAEQLKDSPKAIEAFDLVREIPQIVDGIRCQCGCAELPDKYSLLSCYEGDGMAQHCQVCQGQGRLAHRLFKAGKTLDEIRQAIDARFGS